MPGARERPDGRSERWRAHRQERRDQLVRATVAALDRFGPDASLEQFASVAGIPKPKIYRYFDDRAALVDAVGEWLRAAVRERVKAVAAAEATLRDRIELSLKVLYELIEEHPNTFLFLRAGQHSGSGGAAALSDIVRWVARPVLAPLVPGSRRADEPDATSAEVEPVLHAVVSSVLGAGEWWVRQPRETRVTVERLARSLGATVMGAVEAASEVVGLAAPTTPPTNAAPTREGADEQ